MPQGTVRWFDAERGFGFLATEDSSPDVFVHASEIVEDGGAKMLREGQAVVFEVGENDRGPQALRVRVTADAATGSAVGLLGTVNWYEPGKGYGFASPDGGGADIFVHSSAIVTGGVVTEGQRVAFLVVEGERGPQAGHVIPLGPGAGSPAAARRWISRQLVMRWRGVSVKPTEGHLGSQNPHSMQRSTRGSAGGRGLRWRRWASASLVRITPGFKRPVGSKSCLISAIRSQASRPHSSSTKGAMLRPVPCSALRAPS